MQYHAIQCNTMQYHVNCVTKSTIHKIALNLNLNLNRCLCSHCSCCSHCSRCRHCRQTKGGFPLQPLRGRNKVSKIMLVMVQIPYVNCPYIFGTLAEGWPPPLLEELDEHFLGVLFCFQVCSIADQVSVHYLPNICKFDWKPPQQKWQKLTTKRRDGWPQFRGILLPPILLVLWAKWTLGWKSFFLAPQVLYQSTQSKGYPLYHPSIPSHFFSDAH